MSLLKNILKPFVDFAPEAQKEGLPEVERSEQKKSATERAHTEPNVLADNSVNMVSFNTSPVSSPKSVALDDYYQYFENLIEEANTNNPLFEGTDFKEFIDSKIDVEAIADEETRYKTAFNVLKRTGLTKERLVITGGQYLKLIDEDLKGFADAYNQQYKADVEQKEQLLQKKAEELKSLNDKISAMNQEMKQLSEQVIQNKEKLNTNKNAFSDAGENKKKEIEIELQKIARYF